MNPYPTWNLIIASLGLIILGYYLGGFFQINYIIGAAGLLMGIYNLRRKKQ